MRIQMIQRNVCLFASLPTAFIKAVNFFIATTGTFSRRMTGDRIRYEVDGLKTLYTILAVEQVDTR